MPSVRVQVRAANGEIAVTGTTNSAGSFSFAGLNPGTYTVEILDAAGNIVGTSASVAVTAGATAAVTVTAAAAGAIAAAAGGGLSLFGLGTIATVAVIGAAGAATIIAVQATSDDAQARRGKTGGPSPLSLSEQPSSLNTDLGERATHEKWIGPSVREVFLRSTGSTPLSTPATPVEPPTEVPARSSGCELRGR